MAKGTEEFAEIGDCRVRIMRGGAGPNLLFLHGSGGASTWTPFMQDLSERFHLIVPEHPGFGGSDSPSWLKGVSDLAYFYLDFLEAQGLDDVHLVGNSLGGWIALEIAVRNAVRLRTLSLISPGGLYLEGSPVGDIFGWQMKDFARNIFVNADFAANYEKQVAAMDPAILKKNNTTLEKIARSPLLCNPQLAPWLHRVKRPTLLLWGDRDKVFPVAHATEFLKLIPQAKMNVISECGHLPHVEKRAVVVESIFDFLGVRAKAA